MRCILCEQFSFNTICKTCQNNLLKPDLSKRILKSGLIIYSFYDYDEIGDLLKAKKSYLGFYILNILAKLSLKKFAENWNGINLQAIPIDDKISEFGYSHTAILSHSMKSEKIKPLYNTIISQSGVKYFGQSLKFRQENKREFKLLRDISNLNIVLVDDVITTGSTFLEAEEKIKNGNGYPLFGITLASTNLTTN
jgi:competence protein ComFC